LPPGASPDTLEPIHPKEQRMNKGNTIKAVVAVVVLLIAVFIILKTSTSIFESKPSAGAPGADPNKYSPGQKPKAE
jgi:hypothetical protein